MTYAYNLRAHCLLLVVIPCQTSVSIKRKEKVKKTEHELVAEWKMNIFVNKKEKRSMSAYSMG